MGKRVMESLDTRKSKADSLAIKGIVAISIHSELSNEVMIFHVFNYFIRQRRINLL